MPATSNDPAAVAARLADRLEEDGIPYALSGALALAAHGFPRATADVDVSTFVPDAEIDRLLDAVERAGCLFERGGARATSQRSCDQTRDLRGDPHEHWLPQQIARLVVGRL